MNLVRGARVASTLALGTALLFSGGCGYKNLPAPPESVVPEAIEDLRYTIDEKGVKLTWSYPVETIKGTDISDVAAFDLYRAVVSLEEYCGTCPIPYTEPQEISGGVTIEEGMRRTATYESALLRPGNKYFFKVRSRTSWWAASDDSNVVSFVWHVPAAAPEGLIAVAADRQISLSWQPVTILLDGSSVELPLLYQVRRSIGGQDFENLGEAVSGTGYVDRQVINGKKYYYQVQSVMSFEKDLVQGGVGETIAASPVDQTPPLPPSGVTAVQTGVGTKIFWDRSKEKDLGGYRVYRRAADKSEYDLLGEAKSAYTIFVDSTGKTDVRYYYAVTAIDQATPPNESEKSREATLRR